MLLTFEQQEELVSKGLAVAKTNGNLRTYKYHRKVMFDYLWKKHPELLECRGHTYDITDGKLIIAAPTKTFNYLEDGHWGDVPLDIEVTLYKKFNGFMATVSVHNGEVIVATTGTTNSDYVKMAREQIFKTWPMHKIKEWPEDATWLFEICHKNDPHIVQEKLGAHYLGARMRETGEYFPAASIKVRKNSWYSCTLAEALDIVKHDKGEGFMMYDEDGNCAKLKTPYYTGKKKLMRSSDTFITELWNDKGFDKLPEMWHSVVYELTRNIWESDWRSYNEQKRRIILEEIYE